MLYTHYHYLSVTLPAHSSATVCISVLKKINHKIQTEYKIKKSKNQKIKKSKNQKIKKSKNQKIKKSKNQKIKKYKNCFCAVASGPPYYKGQPPYCLSCNTFGHFARRCQQGKAKNTIQC